MVSSYFLTLCLLCILPALSQGLICSCNDKKSCPSDQCETDGVCIHSLTRRNGHIKQRLECIPKDRLIPKDRPFVCEHSEARSHQFKSSCCKDEDLCNLSLNLTLDVDLDTDKQVLVGNQSDINIVHVIIFTLGAFIVLLVAGFFLCPIPQWRDKKLRGWPCCQAYMEVESLVLETQSYQTNATNITDLISTTGSSSGAGNPVLEERTIARQIELKERIGTGRFGEVYRGEWRAGNVAVKIFSTKDENSWFREVEIYQTCMLRHDNVLGFIAADNKDIGTWTQLWLVTQFMEKGSLYDYLTNNTINADQCLQICQDIVNGLAHLHLEILGTQGKPAIAHRDLKSKNILVRADGTCSIGDLGLAVRYSNNSLDIPPNSKVGTKRYLPPEVLKETINKDDFESYKRGDVYALGLVYWEVASRTRVEAFPTPSYQPPYSNLVGVDPSIEIMKKVVCDDMSRPDLPAAWRSSGEIEDTMYRTMTECWYEDPKARLPTLRITKNLTKLRKQLKSHLNT